MANASGWFRIMSDQPIPAEVLKFIEQYIDTVPQMEALLLISESKPRLWTATTLAERLYVTESLAKRILLDLQRRNLIVGCGEDDAMASYVAGEDATHLISSVVESYRRNLVLVARLIHSKGSPAMQEFSRAFQFKEK